MVPIATRLVPLTLTHEYFHNQRFLTLVMEIFFMSRSRGNQAFGNIPTSHGKKMNKSWSYGEELKHPHYQGSTNQTSLRIFQTIG